MSFFIRRFIIGLQQRKYLLLFPFILSLATYIFIDVMGRSFVLPWEITLSNAKLGSVNATDYARMVTFNKNFASRFHDDLTQEQVSLLLVAYLQESSLDDKGYLISRYAQVRDYNQEELMIRKNHFINALFAHFYLKKNEVNNSLELVYTGKNKKVGQQFLRYVVDGLENHFKLTVQSRQNNFTHSVSGIENLIERYKKEKKPSTDLADLERRKQEAQDKIKEHELLAQVGFQVKPLLETEVRGRWSEILLDKVIGSFFIYLLITLGVIFYLEMTGPFFTTEREVGDYIDLPVVLSIKKLNY